MTTELFYLTLTALLLACLWMPYVIGVNTSKEVVNDFKVAAPVLTYPAWIQRAHRAQGNLTEQFGPFTALVIILHVLEISTAWTVMACVGFFYLRVAHAVIMLAGESRFYLRPIVFTGAWACVLVLGGTLILQ